ncbi:alpha-1,2-fucosyltransferase [Microbacterium gallinarum]|uniref:Alpha-1,2-fucosyltransferase n=1 Tax=Microbacterium gallinarum TaxID=2762209 RepID=A0ABR8X349_9MICO|nr:alpha-1,2-fucosyltransferase [Microbacterium gallinarum]MBD8023744.1 alpha-1,2-fucosyltransferase [Microbacterium gallinarum]
MSGEHSITLWLQGGLGNQLFQLNAGDLLAKSTGGRLRISTASYARDRKRSFELDRLTSDIPRASIAEIALTGSPYNRAGVLRHRTAPLRREIVTSIAERPAGNALLVGFFQDQASIQGGTKRTVQRLRSVTLSKTGSLISRRVAGAPVAHVRRGDYVSLDSSVRTFGTIRPEYYFDAFDYLGVSPAAIYYFTDDPDYVYRTFGARRAQIISADDLRSPLETILAMGSAGDLVIPNSTFSWWAGELLAPAGRTIGPRTWFFDRDDHLSPARDSWIRIDN